MNNQIDSTKISREHAWLENHVHHPNPEPQNQDPTIQLCLPNGQPSHQVDLPLLRTLPAVSVVDCYIISTGHGISGPFTFTGVRVEVLIEHCFQQWLQKSKRQLDLRWDYADIISVDGFGTRIFAHEIHSKVQRKVHSAAILLAYEMDGVEMSRAQGLVRLIVPTEQDDALRQVKWIATIELGLS